MSDITLEQAIESDKFGLFITYDGDNHSILYGSICSHCGEYFESKNISLYCDHCIEVYNSYKEYELINKLNK